MLRLNNGVRDKPDEVDSGCLLKKKNFFSMLRVFIHVFNLQNIKIFYYRFCADTHSNWTSLPESWIQWKGRLGLFSSQVYFGFK